MVQSPDRLKKERTIRGLDTRSVGVIMVLVVAGFGMALIPFMRGFQQHNTEQAIKPEYERDPRQSGPRGSLDSELQAYMDAEDKPQEMPSTPPPEEAQKVVL